MGILDTFFEDRRTRQAAELLYCGEPSAEAALSRLRPKSQREALVHVAHEWMREEREEEAARLLERVLSDAPDDVPALRLKAELQGESNPEQAAETLSRPVRLVPGNRPSRSSWPTP